MRASPPQRAHTSTFTRNTSRNKSAHRRRRVRGTGQARPSVIGTVADTTGPVVIAGRDTVAGRLTLDDLPQGR